MNQRKPRVLMISLEKGLFEPGPIRERIVKQCADFELTWIIVFDKRKFDQELAPNVRVVSTGSWNKIFYVFDACRIAFRLRKKGAFDAVVTQDPVETGLVGAWAARMAQCALAVQDHGYYFHGDYFRKESFLNRFRYWFARWLVKRADAVRVVSERTENALINLGVARERMVRFPLSIQSTKYEVRSTGEASGDVLRTQYSVQDARTPYFLTACRFVPIKRIDLAIHAFSLVAGRHPDVKLKIIGRGPLEDFVRQKISEFNLMDRVEIIPWTDGLNGLYRDAVATLITSDREGFGMTAVESLLAGTPVVMTDVGCAGEVVKDGENGYVVPVGDVDALAKRMQDVLEKPEVLRAGVEGFVWRTSEDGMGDLVERAREIRGSDSPMGVRMSDEPQPTNNTGGLKLLFVTQVVDKKDPILGFAIRWIQEFVNQNVKMTVFARRMVKKDLPEGVMGVDMGQPIVGRVLKMWWHSIKLRREYDAVLVHMTPQLVVLGAPLWKIMGKRVYMWYMHRSVTWWLRAALWMTDRTLTASDLSLRVDSPKKTVVGHGIDTDQFKPIEGLKREPVVLWVSRIQPRKHLERSLEFMAAFKDAYPDVPWRMRVIGIADGHEDYLESCKKRAVELGISERVIFEGPIEHDELPRVFASAAAFLSTSQTGSIDKVVLEALSCGTPVLAEGEEYVDLPGVVKLYTGRSENLKSIFERLGTSTLARDGVVAKHNLRRLVTRLIDAIG